MCRNQYVGADAQLHHFFKCPGQDFDLRRYGEAKVSRFAGQAINRFGAHEQHNGDGPADGSQLAFEITDGRVLWQQTVGVPPGSGLPGRTRSYSLLAHRLPASTMLYLRVEDPDRGVIYCTTQLGRYLATGTPGVLIDHGNEIHILHAMAPKEYLYSHFGLDGKVRTQQAYRDWGSRPALAPTDDGGVRVVGGTPYDPKATPPEEKLPGLGEHPVPIPKSAPTPTPKKEDRPPENLLSR